MARYCSDCTYLCVNDKGHGKYKCSKIKKDVLANMPACDKFDKAYSRKRYDCEKIYDMAKDLSKKPIDDSSPGTLLLKAIILIIIIVLLRIFYK